MTLHSTKPNLVSHVSRQEPLKEQGAIPIRILLVEDNELARNQLQQLLQRANKQFQVDTVNDVKKAMAALEDNTYRVVLTDLRMPGSDGISLVRTIQERQLAPVVIVITAYGNIQDAVQAMRHGAYDFLTKPIDVEHVCLVIDRALREHSLRDEVAVLRTRLKQQFSFFNVLSKNPRMHAIFELITNIGPTSTTVLIEGETGTGKELLARAVHFHSRRAASPLMVQNAGGMRDELLHSDLFGHCRGSFTSAASDRLGLFRAADGGTVFLDEISDVSPSFQVSLLRFLQEGEVKPLGSDRILHADVRIIAASNKPLKQLVKAGSFREDLYFRLKGFEFEVPPLRARPDDIPVLTEFFVRKHGSLLSNRVLGVTNDVLNILKSYHYPGNVRELENEVRRMVALVKDGEYLTRRYLSPTFAKVRVNPQGFGVGLKAEGKTLKEMVESLEGQFVYHVLEKNRWNQSKAARELGLSRVGLANKIRRYALTEGKPAMS